MVKVNYIYHSCFAVETDNALLVYDYWKDSQDMKLHTLIDNRGEKQLYFIESHFHEDHFNPEIQDYADARLLISYDTSKRRRIKPPVATAVLRPADIYEDEYLKLYALRSTDVGIASLVSLSDGTTIYHAGDNNNWYFTDPDHPDADRVKVSLDQMEKLFLSTLREIKKDFPRLDHAMFPVDPRLEQEMLRGMFQLLKTIEVGQLHPMHFCLPPEIA